MLFKIPLNNTPETFEISIAGATYNLTVKYNDAENAGWVLDIANENSEYILQGVPLVTGADLLEQYKYLNLGFSIYVFSDVDFYAVPTYENLGVESNLYIFSEF